MPILRTEGAEGARVELTNPGQPPVSAIAEALTPADLPTGIPLANLEDIPPGTVVGRPADGVAGPPTPLVGGDIADIVRFDNLAVETVGGALNNVALGLVDQWRIEATSVISGVVPPVPNTGRDLVIENATGFGSGVTVTLLHDSGLSSSTSRLHIPPGQAGNQVVLRPLETATFRYVISRWKLIALGGPVVAAVVGQQQLQGGILASLLGTTPTADNATTNLSVGAITIAGNTTQVGTTYIANLSVEFVHTASANPTLTLEWVYGGTVVASRVITVTAIAGTYTLWVEGYFRHTTIGVGSSARVSIRSVCTAGATVADQIGDTTAVPAALNTTISRTLELRVRMTTAVASNNITLHQALIQRLINM